MVKAIGSVIYCFGIKGGIGERPVRVAIIEDKLEMMETSKRP